MDFAIPEDHEMKIKEREKIDEYLDLARELKKVWNRRVKLISVVVGHWNVTQGLESGSGRVGNRKKNRDHQNYSIDKIGQDTEKNPGDLRRLALTETPVKDHQLTLV